MDTMQFTKNNILILMVAVSNNGNGGKLRSSFAVNIC